MNFQITYIFIEICIDNKAPDQPRSSQFPHHRMALPRSHSLVAPPIYVPKRVQKLVESPIKVPAPSMSHLIAPPYSEFGEKSPRTRVAAKIPPSELSSGNPKIPLHPNKRQKRAKNTPEQSNASSQTNVFKHEGGFGDDEGDFGTGFHDIKSRRSTPHVSAGQDRIDGSVAGQEIVELKTKVVPMYWEKLQDTAYAAVRVTPRLYILQNWNRHGYLMVI